MGDVMLDDYLWGDTSRISPEAPVPLVELLRRTYAPGGAANVARGIAALEGIPLLTGVTGDDDAGTRLRSALAELDVGLDGLIVAPGRRTTTKLRVIAGSQQLVRVDHEQRDDVDEGLATRLVDWVAANVGSADALVVSDYAKGAVSSRTCASAIAAARGANIPVIVDPKGRDFSKYRDATVIAPNLEEARLAVRAQAGASVDSLAERLAEQLPGTNIVITLGPDGMLLRSADERVTTIDVETHDARDITGAGDTVAATVAAALAGGMEVEQAARLANRAAAISVTRVGVATVSLEELLNATA
jgi:rfaE bifunctional protein kinase chain/domain